MIPKERKELFAGTAADCAEYIANHAAADRLEVIANTIPGPSHSVYWRRRNRDSSRAVSRETRGTVRTNGGKERTLIVTLAPGDVITFRAKGTHQELSVPIASLYQFARFTAAKAIAAQKKTNRKKN